MRWRRRRGLGAVGQENRRGEEELPEGVDPAESVLVGEGGKTSSQLAEAVVESRHPLPLPAVGFSTLESTHYDRMAAFPSIGCIVPFVELFLQALFLQASDRMSQVGVWQDGDQGSLDGHFCVVSFLGRLVSFKMNHNQ